MKASQSFIGRATFALATSVFLSVQWLAGADETKSSTSNQTLDPAAWGDDHVGQPLPEYMTGDECLFCHRDIGSLWSENRHQLTVRDVVTGDPAIQSLHDSADGESIAKSVSHLMGGSRVIRFLKRSDAYGKFDLLTAKYTPRTGKLHIEQGQTEGVLNERGRVDWDSTTFGASCAGCHATAVEPTNIAFSSVSLDCFVCHGDVPLDHTKTPEKALLSTANQQPHHAISICAQCHLRGGQSRSSGRPYPNSFVAGDNLFRDYRVDLSEAAVAELPIGQRHILQNVRDVAILGQSKTTCLSCHAVHDQNSEKHQGLANLAICTSCHVPNANGELRQDYLRLRDRVPHNATCEY